MNLLLKLWYRFRSAITGRFIKKEEAIKSPDTTVREKVKPKNKSK